jgi:hypothetical protein
MHFPFFIFMGRRRRIDIYLDLTVAIEPSAARRDIDYMSLAAVLDAATDDTRRQPTSCSIYIRRQKRTWLAVATAAAN